MKYYLKCFKNYATFTGRARRSEFWYFVLFNLLIITFLEFVGELINSDILENIYKFGVLIPMVAVTIRRMHDVDKSAWYALIPLYGWILLPLREGSSGNNNYGVSPKKLKTIIP